MNVTKCKHWIRFESEAEEYDWVQFSRGKAPGSIVVRTSNDEYGGDGEIELSIIDRFELDLWMGKVKT